MRISVVVPAYNAERTMSFCLEALLCQDIPREEYEVIVVDDGSIDATAAVVSRFPVRLLAQANQGPAAARNRGAAAAAGELLLFTDADCVPEPGWIAAMIVPFADRQVVAVKGSYRTRQREIVARFAQLEFEERFTMLAERASIDMVDTYAAAYRREVFLDLRGFDTSFPEANNEDTELSYRMASQGMKMVFAPNAVVYHLRHPDSLVRYARLKFGRGYWRMVVYRRYPGKMLRDSYTPQSLKIQILLLFMLLPTSLLPLVWSQSAAGLPSVFLLLGYGVSVAPFTRMALRRDLLVGICAPLLLALRAAALGAGAVAGAWGGRCR